jgi:hypothetical protein
MYLSGRGQMTQANFKPNGNATQLSGDWDEMLFFYDVDPERCFYSDHFQRIC